MAYVCYDCKLGYGHPLVWCPGCGRKMIKVKDYNWNELRQKNWKLEGDKNLYEYFIDGIRLDDGKDSHYELVQAVIKANPWICDLFPDIKNYTEKSPTPIFLKWIRGDRDVSIYFQNKEFTVRFDKPRLTFRLKGSNLDINYVGYSEDVPLRKDLI